METLSTEIEATLQAWREQGESIVFTNGVFDILHAGHVTYLKGARELGSRLIVGVNADASVRMLGKGPNRPINDEASRKLVLEALRSVDVAVVFSSQTPMDLIAQIRPNVLVKGGIMILKLRAKMINVTSLVPAKFWNTVEKSQSFPFWKAILLQPSLKKAVPKVETAFY